VEGLRRRKRIVAIIMHATSRAPTMARVIVSTRIVLSDFWGGVGDCDGDEDEEGADGVGRSDMRLQFGQQ
jgi:hypothetical protein